MAIIPSGHTQQGTNAGSPPSAPPPQSEPAPKPRRINRRTLRKRIIRNMNYLSSVNLLLFSGVLLIMAAVVFRPVSYGISSYLGTSIAEDISSPIVLQHFGADSLAELDMNDPEVSEWVTSRIEQVTKFNEDDFSFEWYGENGKSMREDPVYIQFQWGGETRYSNVPASLSLAEGSVIQQMIDYYNMEFVHTFTDENTGKPLGSVLVGIHPVIPVALTIGMLIVMLLLYFAALLLSRLMSLLLTVPLIGPINQLEQKVKAIADGDFESSKGATIVLKRPLREMESLMESTNRIMQTHQRYAEQLEQQKAMVEAQNDELEAQNDELARSKERLQEAQSLLSKKERSVRSLLDNAKQGFLTFGPELEIDEEFSREAGRLCGGDIAGRPFPDLIAAGDTEQIRFTERLLRKLFEEQDQDRRDMLLPLLPDEIKLGDTYVHIDYVMIAPDDSDAAAEGERCMVILTDVTETKQLQNRMEQERNTLQMVVKVVVGYNEYSSLVQSFTEWYAKPFDPEIPDDRMKSALFDLFRVVHTFKGSFAQIGMTQLAGKLHEAESVISAWNKQPEPPAAEEVLRQLYALRMPEWLEDEQRVLRSVLGDSFFEQEHVLLVDRSKIIGLERKMMETLSSSECEQLLPELRKLRYTPFKDLLASYPDYIAGLSERFDKAIAPVEMEGGDFLVDSEKYIHLTRSLIHLFRNAVDHGIESPDERAAAGKSEAGRIRCEMSLQDGEIRLSIQDDGQGIDLAKLKRKVVEHGVFSEEQVGNMSEEEALMLVFLGEVSSKDEVTETSGRGVGLAAVMYEVEKLDGKITVSSEPGAGSIFHITLPYHALSDVPEVTPSSLLLPVAETAVAFFTENAYIQLQFSGEVQIQTGGKLPLLNFTTFMSVQGASNGLFILTMNEQSAEVLTRRLAYGELAPEEIALYMEDTLAEAANMILGNSLQKMTDVAPYLAVHPPITVFTEGASMKVAESEMCSATLRGSEGMIMIGFIKMK